MNPEGSVPAPTTLRASGQVVVAEGRTRRRPHSTAKSSHLRDCQRYCLANCASRAFSAFSAASRCSVGSALAIASSMQAT